MRSIQYTANLHLSQIEDESLPWWYGTINEDNRKIDEAVNDVEDKVDELNAELNTEETGLVAKVNELDDEINNEETGISAKVNELDNEINNEDDGIITALNVFGQSLSDLTNYLTLGERHTLIASDITVVSGAAAFGEWGQGSVSSFPSYRLNSTKKLGIIFGNFAISGFAQNGGRVVLGLGFKVNNSTGSDYNVGAIAGMAIKNGSGNSWIPISSTYFTIKANGDVQFTFLVANAGGQYDLKFWLPPCLMMFD